MSDLPTKEQLWDSKVRQIVASLGKRPALLYDVMLILLDEYEVLGPWQEGFQQTWCRKDIKGQTVASVIPKDGPNGTWSWAYYDSRGYVLAHSQEDLGDMVEAMRQADEYLQGGGFLLA